jgi:hypothetical protein
MIKRYNWLWTKGESLEAQRLYYEIKQLQWEIEEKEREFIEKLVKKLS